MSACVDKVETARRLRLYLGEYFVKEVQPSHTDLVAPFVAGDGQWKDRYVMAVRVHSEQAERSLGAAAVLAHGRHIWWETHGCYSLVERYFESVPVVNECSEPEFLVLVFSRQVVPNKITVPLMAEILQARSAKKLRTLVLSYRDVQDLGVDFTNVHGFSSGPSDMV